ncbi:hypothetical protein Dimus_036664 [Dionaea muscipula]
MRKKLRKKSKKILGEWVCPSIVQGLSVEFKYPSSEEDNCSLHTIDEEEIDETLDGDSIHSDGDVSEDLHHFRDFQRGQCSHEEAEFLQTSPDTIRDPPSNPPLMVLSEIGDAILEEPDDEIGLHGDNPNLHAPCDSSTMEIPAQTCLNLDPFPNPQLQLQSEEGQKSRMAMDDPNFFDDERIRNSGLPEPLIKATTMQNPQAERGNTDEPDLTPPFHIETGQHSGSHADEHTEMHREMTHDTPLDTDATCSESEEQNRPVIERTCLTQHCPPVTNSSTTSHRDKKLDPEGFQPVQKKGQKKSKNAGKDFMEHHQDLPYLAKK